jgi:integrase
MGNRKGVRQVSASSYEISFQFNGVRCREKIKLPPTKINFEHVVNLRGEILNQIERGTFDYAKYFPESPRAKTLSKIPGFAITIEDALERWLKRAKTEVQKSTYIDYEKSVHNHLIPAFGQLTLAQIKKSDVRNWSSRLTCSGKRISNMLTPLRQVLADAFDDEVIPKNPLYGWTIKRKGDKKPRPDPFTPEELSRILANADGQIFNLISFWAWTGLRTSEINALKWGDVDSEFVHIRRALVENEIKGTKTEAGNRSVLLLSPAVQALKKQRRYTYFAGEAVFHNPRTNAAWKSNKAFPEHYWKPLLKKVEVRYRRPYQLRHTYASTMLSSGENIHWLARQMGHSDATMILRTYGKWIPDVDPSAGSKAEELARKHTT